jgi:hypothetical protein
LRVGIGDTRYQRGDRRIVGPAEQIRFIRLEHTSFHADRRFAG